MIVVVFCFDSKKIDPIWDTQNEKIFDLPGRNHTDWPPENENVIQNGVKKTTPEIFQSVPGLLPEKELTSNFFKK